MTVRAPDVTTYSVRQDDPFGDVMIGSSFDPDMPPHRCPDCGSSNMKCQRDNELENFRCENCGSCWHAALGFVYRVNSQFCEGCKEKARCAVLAEDGMRNDVEK